MKKNGFQIQYVVKCLQSGKVVTGRHSGERTDCYKALRKAFKQSEK